MLQVQCYRFFLKYFPIGRKNLSIQLPTLSPCKNGIEWLKDERTSDIISFKCLLPKADFIIFYFELETLLNKLVELCSSFFFRKIILKKNAESIIFVKNVNLFTNRRWYKKRTKGFLVFSGAIKWNLWPEMGLWTEIGLCTLDSLHVKYPCQELFWSVISCIRTENRPENLNKDSFYTVINTVMKLKL